MIKLPLHLFVYGTLLSGLENHFYITGSKFIGKAKTIDKYSLYHLDYPKATQKQNQIEIIGEVYLIEDIETLQRIDELEEHPTVYLRTSCKVILNESNEIINAQIYFNDNFDIKHKNCINIANGDFREFLSTNSQNK